MRLPPLSQYFISISTVIKILQEVIHYSSAWVQIFNVYCFFSLLPFTVLLTSPIVLSLSRLWFRDMYTYLYIMTLGTATASNWRDFIGGWTKYFSWSGVEGIIIILLVKKSWRILIIQETTELELEVTYFLPSTLAYFFWPRCLLATLLYQLWLVLYLTK